MPSTRFVSPWALQSGANDPDQSSLRRARDSRQEIRGGVSETDTKLANAERKRKFMSKGIYKDVRGGGWGGREAFINGLSLVRSLVLHTRSQWNRHGVYGLSMAARRVECS